MKKVLSLSFLIVLACFMLAGCKPQKNFVGTWKTDVFDQGDSRETASKIVGKASGQEALASFIAKMVHWNATMEIKQDGTLIMNSGEEFSATWKQDGDKIIIQGKNISGVATLSDDQQTLYFENKPLDDSSEQNGIVIGENSLMFEFKKVEQE